jgi:UDP-glucose 4-epimerase
MIILVTGSAGFICGYAIEELLKHGHQVIGLDNFSKYGPVDKSYSHHPGYRFIKADAKDANLLKECLADCDQILAAAAMIGGITYFHELSYDLMAENERITAAIFDAAIWAYREKRLKKINVLSSSMVYESVEVFPTPEGEQLRCPPPKSTYGFQKLACEYFAKGAQEQYQLPYTIIRPFNCVGVGEGRALQGKTVLSGNIRLAMSHVIPDLVQKVLKGQDPIRLLGNGQQLRHYTYGGDLARGIRLCIENENAINEDFNLSTNKSTTVLELAEMIWMKIQPDKPFRYICEEPYPNDVQKRVPDVQKAKRILGFEANTGLSQVLDEVIPWIKAQIECGNL